MILQVWYPISRSMFVWFDFSGRRSLRHLWFSQIPPADALPTVHTDKWWTCIGCWIDSIIHRQDWREFGKSMTKPYIYILCCYFGRLPRLFRPFRLSSLRKSDAFIVGFWFGFLGNTFPPKPRHWWDDSLMTFLSKGPKYWIYLDKIANSIICFFEKTPTRKLVSQSPSDEGSGSQIELWKWQASAVPLFACSSAWYLLPWKTVSTCHQKDCGETK